jgi:TRAP-type C4-dicarboxylate transport system permease small subunit
MEAKKIAKHTWHWFTKSEDYAAILALLISVGLVNLAVASRIVFNYEDPAWEELARFASLWMYLIGVVVTSKEGSHLRMGFFETRLSSPKTRAVLEMVNDVIMLVILIIFTWWAIGDIVTSIQRGEASLILRVGMWTVRSSFIVGGLLSALHILLLLIKHAREYSKHSKGVK